MEGEIERERERERERESRSEFTAEYTPQKAVSLGTRMHQTFVVGSTEVSLCCPVAFNGEVTSES